jgi:lysozyme family protein
MPVVILQRDGTPGVTAAQFNDANQQHLVNEVALVRLLIAKGLITQDEYSRAHMRATAEVDQVYAEHRESVIRQMAGLPPEEPDGPDADSPNNDASEGGNDNDG